MVAIPLPVITLPCAYGPAIKLLLNVVASVGTDSLTGLAVVCLAGIISPGKLNTDTQRTGSV
jgi:hypothetical protein